MARHEATWTSGAGHNALVDQQLQIARDRIEDRIGAACLGVGDAGAIGQRLEPLTEPVGPQLRRIARVAFDHQLLAGIDGRGVHIELVVIAMLDHIEHRQLDDVIATAGNVNNLEIGQLLGCEGGQVQGHAGSVKSDGIGTTARIHPQSCGGQVTLVEHDGVVASTAIDHIRAAIACQHIVTQTANEPVGATGAIERVIGRGADAITGQSIERVGCVSADLLTTP